MGQQDENEGQTHNSGLTKSGLICFLKHLCKVQHLKEWTYAGFFFAMSGAIFSHIASGNSISEIAPPVLLLLLTMVSWYFRPVSYAAPAGEIYGTRIGG